MEFDTTSVIYPNAIPLSTLPPLRPYQQPAFDFLQTQERGLVAGPTGCGKTYIGRNCIARFGFHRLLIVCSTRSFHKWTEEAIEALYPNNTPNILILGGKDAKARALGWAWAREASKDPRIVLCSWGTLRQDYRLIAEHCEGMSSSPWDMMIFDESQNIRNHQTQNFKRTATICRNKIRTFFFSGTEANKGAHNLWTHLHIFAPRAFPSYWKFVDRYMVQAATGERSVIIGQKKATAAELRERLKYYVYKIREEDTRGYVPERNRIKMKIDLAPKVAKLYDRFDCDMVYDFRDGSDPLVVPNQAAKRVKLRQLAACPKLIHPSLPYGTGIEAIVDHARSVGEERIAIFTAFPEMFPHLEAYLRVKAKYDYVFSLRGNATPEEVATLPKQFDRLAEDPKNKRMAFLLSISFADSFDLRSPRNGYLLGFAEDTSVNTQAEGRLLRGDKPYANFYYVIHTNTVEEEVMSVLNRNHKAISRIYKRSESIA